MFGRRGEVDFCVICFVIENSSATPVQIEVNKQINKNQCDVLTAAARSHKSAKLNVTLCHCGNRKLHLRMSENV